MKLILLRSAKVFLLWGRKGKEQIYPWEYLLKCKDYQGKGGALYWYQRNQE